ncbi:MAG: hypothetical protein K2W88_15075 [Pararheinheimera sp.]|nr:hypothetical protein [Rheinheimera sp.]
MSGEHRQTDKPRCYALTFLALAIKPAKTHIPHGFRSAPKSAQWNSETECSTEKPTDLQQLTANFHRNDFAEITESAYVFFAHDAKSITLPQIEFSDIMKLYQRVFAEVAIKPCRN